MAQSRGNGIGRNEVLALAVIGFCAVLLLIRFVRLLSPGPGGPWAFLDFEDFYLVGWMARTGRIVEAYAYFPMFKAQMLAGAQENFMPWTYPPQFDLVVWGLAFLRQAWAYAVLVGLPLAAYFWMLWRIAGRQAAGPVLAMTPALMICILCGQNGLLTADLVGLVALASLKGRSVAGVPLGLLAIKPHLGLTLGLVALAGGRWRTLTLALLVVGLTSLAATLVFGPGIWGAFAEGMALAGRNLGERIYPFYRMVSVYSLLHPLGAPHIVASAAQTGVALAVGGALVLLVRRRAEPRVVLGAAALGALAVSPYAYDYDVPILGVGLALLAPLLQARAAPAERLAIGVLAWITGGGGLVESILRVRFMAHRELLEYIYMPSAAGAGYLVLLVVVGRVIWRALATPEEMQHLRNFSGLRWKLRV